MDAIRIADSYFPLPAGTIAYTITANSLKELDTRQGISSNDFDLPVSRNLLQVLNLYGIFQANDTVSNRRIDAELLQDNQLVQKGTIQVLSRSKDTIRLCFYAGNADWFELAKNLTFSDIDFSRYDHTWTVNNVADRLQRTDGVCYPLIDYGMIEGRATEEIEVREMLPAMYLKTLFFEIWRELGITVSGELLNDYRFNKTLLPFSRDKFSYDTDGLDVANFSLSIEGGFQLVENSTPQAAWSGTYTEGQSYVNRSGRSFYMRYDFDGSLQLLRTGTVTKDSTMLEIRKNGVSFVTVSDINIAASNAIPQGVQAGLAVAQQGTILIEPNDILTIYTGSIDNNLNFTATPNEGIQATFEAAEILQIGDVVTQDTYLPDIDIADLLKWIIISWGCVVQYKPLTKTLTFDFFDRIEGKKTQARDWSGKQDIGRGFSREDEELTRDYAQKTIIRYEEAPDDDEALKLYEQLNDAGLGQGFFNIQNVYLDREKEYYTAPFTSSRQVSTFDLSMPSIPVYGSENILRPSGNIVAFSASGTNTRVQTQSAHELRSTTQTVLITIENTSNYNGTFELVNIINSTDFIIDTAFVADDGRGSFSSVIYNYEIDKTPEPRVLLAEPLTLTDISGGTTTELRLYDSRAGGASQNISDVLFSWFHKPSINTLLDGFNKQLSYGQVVGSAFGDTFLSDYWQAYISALQNGYYLEAFFRLKYTDVSDFDHIVPVYVAGKGYFYVDSIEDYDGAAHVYKVNLVKIS